MFIDDKSRFYSSIAAVILSFVTGHNNLALVTCCHDENFAWTSTWWIRFSGFDDHKHTTYIFHVLLKTLTLEYFDNKTAIRFQYFTAHFQCEFNQIHCCQKKVSYNSVIFHHWLTCFKFQVKCVSAGVERSRKIEPHHESLPPTQDEVVAVVLVCVVLRAILLGLFTHQVHRFHRHNMSCRRQKRDGNNIYIYIPYVFVCRGANFFLRRWELKPRYPGHSGRYLRLSTLMLPLKV